MSVGLPDEGKEDRLMKPANASAIPLDGTSTAII
jgi:hypothetical protein